MNKFFPTQSTISLKSQRRIDRVCDLFEVAFNRGEEPIPEEYAKRVSEEHYGPALRELQSLAKHLAAANSLSLTTSANAAARMEEDGEPIPPSIGRFEIHSKIGEGAFGRVLRAYDPQTDRQVAIKVPRKSVLAMQNSLLKEARNAGRLTHPGLVTIHDVQSDGETRYIVQEYIDGWNLSDWYRTTQATKTQMVRVLIDVVDAIGYAHKERMYHRDLKPANILVDREDNAHITDFGLALDERFQNERKGEVAGSPAYMSPEQVRGETHRLDGRTDIWSIGIILYEYLAGRRPFRADSRKELYARILHEDPKPLRELDPSIPQSLDRICDRCLQKLRKDRYRSAVDLKEDLQQWLEMRAVTASALDAANDAPAQQQAMRRQTAIPKGLRAFDDQDADFFLRLLPGPRDLDGLPDSIRFWKNRIEERGDERTFGVGLLYGPSGCGKTSLMKAGLLPRLEPDTRVVYVEATSDETETRLTKALRKVCPPSIDEESLPATLRRFRETAGTDHKVLVVVDQFEQWLHSNEDVSNSALIDSLRQCDGTHLQCILMVRDDFWMPTTRLFRELDIQLVEGENSLAVDLFSSSHAESVLVEFYHAFFEEEASPMEPAHTKFIQRAVADLSENGKVVCVRLALFAEMMKGRPWTVKSLDALGGARGVGVRFLEESLSNAGAPPTHRFHNKACRRILEAMLPPSRTEMRRGLRTFEELFIASGYSSRSDFDDALGVLDRNLRLITPVQSDGQSAEDGSTHVDDRNRCFQLTHDYLVPSIREWLNRQAKGRGDRARLRLAERTELYKSKPEPQQLPSILEYIQIVSLTNRRAWSADQRSVMSAATRYYLQRVVFLAALLTLVGWGTREWFVRYQAQQAIQKLMGARPEALEASLQDVRSYLPWAAPVLARMIENDHLQTPTGKQYARVAMVGEQPTLVADVFEDLLDAEPAVVRAIVIALDEYRAIISDQLWAELDSTASSRRRLRAAIALANYEPDSPNWNAQNLSFLCREIATEAPRDQLIWLDHISAIGKSQCVPQWKRMFDDTALMQLNPVGLARAIVRYGNDDPVLLAGLLTKCSSIQYEMLFSVLKSNSEQKVAKAIALLAKVAAQLPSERAPLERRVALGKARAAAGITLLRLGEFESALRTFELRSDPEAVTQFVHGCKDRGVAADELVSLLEFAVARRGERNDSGDAAIRFGILSALGEFALTDLSEAKQKWVVEQTVNWYREDSSSAIHGVCGWLLETWGRLESKREADLLPVSHSPGREWFNVVVDSVEPCLTMTFVVLSAQRTEGEAFAILDREISFAELMAFDSFFRDEMMETPRFSYLTESHAGFNVDWRDTQEFCDWLSPLIGFEARLPSEGEWVLACRASTLTQYSHGNDVDLLHHYGWFKKNEQRHVRRCRTLRPNLYGLFDFHGNLWEWTDGTPRQRDEQLPKFPVRGGSFGMSSSDLMSESVDYCENATTYIGFRIAVSVEVSKQ